MDEAIEAWAATLTESFADVAGALSPVPAIGLAPIGEW
jgi:hypothetical protein